MSQLFKRKPIADLMSETDSAGGLRRTLGAGDLIMLAIGAVIGAGIFGAIGTAAAGQTGPNGEVIRAGAGPALVFSFLLLGGACALAGLCYAELASMIPQAGSAYAYSYATLGEIVAWIIGWDLILEYAVGNVAVAISWGDYFNTLLRGAGVQTSGVADDRLSHGAAQRRPAGPRADRVGAAHPRHPDPPAHPGVRDRRRDHLAAAARCARERDREQHHGGDQAARAGALHRRRRDAPLGRELPSVRAERLHRHPSGRRDRVLRLHRVRRDFHCGRRDARSATESADRDSRRARHLHGDIRGRRRRVDRHGAVQGTRRRRPAGQGARARRVSCRQRDRRARRGRLDVRGAAGLSVRPAAHFLRDGARRPVAEVGGQDPSA